MKPSTLETIGFFLVMTVAMAVSLWLASGINYH